MLRCHVLATYCVTVCSGAILVPDPTSLTGLCCSRWTKPPPGGALRQHGLLENTVVVSDDAGQFRVATYALCWVHAERHLEKLMPASPKQAKAVELVRQTIWCF